MQLYIYNSWRIKEANVIFITVAKQAELCYFYLYAPIIHYVKVEQYRATETVLKI